MLHFSWIVHVKFGQVYCHMPCFLLWSWPWCFVIWLCLPHTHIHFACHRAYRTWECQSEVVIPVPVPVMLLCLLIPGHFRHILLQLAGCRWAMTSAWSPPLSRWTVMRTAAGPSPRTRWSWPKTRVRLSPTLLLWRTQHGTVGIGHVVCFCSLVCQLNLVVFFCLGSFYPFLCSCFKTFDLRGGADL